MLFSWRIYKVVLLYKEVKFGMVFIFIKNFFEKENKKCVFLGKGQSWCSGAAFSFFLLLKHGKSPLDPWCQSFDETLPYPPPHSIYSASHQTTTYFTNGIAHPYLLFTAQRV